MENQKTMAQVAQETEPTTTKNISELERVSTDIALKDGSGTNKEGEEFTYKFFEVDGEQYRVPKPVLLQLKEHLKEKPDLKEFKVSKKGEGLKTQYTVIPLNN